MASPPQIHTPVVTRKLPPPVGYLYTPPEQTFDSFPREDLRPRSFGADSQTRTKLPPISLGPSPPTSPETVAWSNFRAASDYPPYDAPLYPGNDGRASAQADAPLFESQSSRQSDKENSSPESHVRDLDSVAGESHCRHDPLPRASPAAPRKSDKPRPARSHAEMLNIRNTGDAVAYFHERMRELQTFRSFRVELPSRPARDRLDPFSRKQVNSLGKPSGVTKSKPSPPKPTSAKPAAAKTVAKAKPAQRSATPKRSPKSTSYPDFADSTYSAQEKKHKRAAPTKTVVGAKEDNNKWTELPDFSPPLSTLHDKKLKVEWKHAPLDCSSKDDYDQLHPQEQQVASALRLEPRQYLANKRRIFAARVEQLRNPGNKGWNKTACQQACNIDVNKASQLYEAFLRIGWFDEDLFQKWL